MFVFFCSKDRAGHFLHCLAVTVLWVRYGNLWQPTALVWRAPDLVSSPGMAGHPVNQNHNYFSEYKHTHPVSCIVTMNVFKHWGILFWFVLATD